MDTKVRKFTREQVISIKDDLKGTLTGFCEHYGLAITSMNARFTEDEVTYNLTLAILPEDGKSVEQAKWECYAPIYGLKAEDFGKMVILDGNEYVIAGIDPNARRRTVLVRRNGTTYTVAPSELKRNNDESDAAKEDRIKSEFETAAFLAGLKGKVTYGQMFNFNERQYKVTGINVRAPKYPIIATDVVTGKEYKFPKSALT